VSTSNPAYFAQLATFLSYQCFSIIQPFYGGGQIFLNERRMWLAGRNGQGQVSHNFLIGVTLLYFHAHRKQSWVAQLAFYMNFLCTSSTNCCTCTAVPALVATDTRWRYSWNLSIPFRGTHGPTTNAAQPSKNSGISMINWGPESFESQFR
jgi:hypothetical protein